MVRDIAGEVLAERAKELEAQQREARMAERLRCLGDYLDVALTEIIAEESREVAQLVYRLVKHRHVSSETAAMVNWRMVSSETAAMVNWPPW